ncbi:MAG: rhomboid family intramembrane serine protease [Planctomycetota bacterium]
MQEASLVLASAGIEFSVEVDGRGARILVEEGTLQRAQEEIGAYGKENIAWPPITPMPVRRSDGVQGATLYVFFVVLLQVCAEYGALGLDWWEHGVLKAGSVLGGEYERALTALTLHVDLTHLLSNIVFGVVFGVLTAHALGGGLTWILALLAGGLGNLTNAWVQDASHRSVGASTAVFGLLGVLAAHEWAQRTEEHQLAIRRYGPIMGAAVLLGWLGVGDTQGERRVDVLAHVFGLAHGALLGALAARIHLAQRCGPRRNASSRARRWSPSWRHGALR